MYKYNDIIEYMDGTRDLNFEEARNWALKNNTSFNELLDKRNLPLRYFQIGPAPTIEEQNEEIRQTRQRLFTEQADPLKYDYEESLARYGETDERTIEAKNLWLAKKDEIRENNPYISN